MTPNQTHYRRYREGYLQRSKNRRQRNPAQHLLNMARARARRKGIEFSIGPDDILPLPSHCPVLGIPLRSGNRPHDPNSFSIDRKNNSQGYIPGNVCVISLRANRVKGDASLSEIEQVLKYMEGHE